MQPNSHQLIGALVLGARSSFSLPFFHPEDYQSHVEGSQNGRFAVSATFSNEIFLPSKGRDYYVKSSESLSLDEAAYLTKNVSAREEEGDTLRDSISKAASRSTLLSDRPNLCTVEQRRPYGVSAVVSRAVDTYFIGVHSSAVDFLLWSNCDGLENQLQEYRGLDNFWFYRFLVRSDFGVLLHSKRLASRWYRYSQSNVMRDPAKRFQAFERSLFNGHPD